MTGQRRKTEALTALDDTILEAITGGVSLYDGADDMDRDSWFVRLVRRRMPNAGRGVTPPPGVSGAQGSTVPLTTIIVGEYSPMPGNPQK